MVKSVSTYVQSDLAFHSPLSVLSSVSFNLKSDPMPVNQLKSAFLIVSNSTLYRTTILDCTILKAYADDKINLNEKIKTWFGKGRKHCGKRRKCSGPAFSPFPTVFSKAFSFRVIKIRNCVVKSSIQ